MPGLLLLLEILAPFWSQFKMSLPMFAEVFIHNKNFSGNSGDVGIYSNLGSISCLSGVLGNYSTPQALFF